MQSHLEAVSFAARKKTRPPRHTHTLPTPPPPVGATAGECAQAPGAGHASPRERECMRSVSFFRRTPITPVLFGARPPAPPPPALHPPHHCRTTLTPHSHQFARASGAFPAFRGRSSFFPPFFSSHGRRLRNPPRPQARLRRLPGRRRWRGRVRRPRGRPAGGAGGRAGARRAVGGRRARRRLLLPRPGGSPDGGAGGVYPSV